MEKQKNTRVVWVCSEEEKKEIREASFLTEKTMSEIISECWKKNKKKYLEAIKK